MCVILPRGLTVRCSRSLCQVTLSTVSSGMGMAAALGEVVVPQVGLPLRFCTLSFLVPLSRCLYVRDSSARIDSSLFTLVLLGHAP